MIQFLGPGSDYEHNNWDCGYQLVANGEMTNYSKPPVMGNNRQYRLALNVTVWAALSWSTLLDPVNNFNSCKSNHHFLNYWAQV